MHNSAGLGFIGNGGFPSETHRADEGSGGGGGFAGTIDTAAGLAPVSSAADGGGFTGSGFTGSEFSPSPNTGVEGGDIEDRINGGGSLKGAVAADGDFPSRAAAPPRPVGAFCGKADANSGIWPGKGHGGTL